MGSFSKEHILKISKKNDSLLKEYIEEIEVNCITLNQLFKKHKIEAIELLIVDTESYDWKVISQLNLKEFEPVIILFEHSNLTELERIKSIEYLEGNYYLFLFGYNYLCINKIKIKDLNILKKIAHTSKSLRD